MPEATEAHSTRAPAAPLTIPVSTHDAMLLLVLLDEAHKGNTFPMSVYGERGRAGIARMFTATSKAINAARGAR